MTRLGVVIPAYNAAQWIARSVGSVRAQSAAPAALIVVDDGSSDDTVAVARALDGVTVLTGENRGACHARNRGAEAAVAAGATHLLFLDADDEIAGEYIAGAERAGAAADLIFAPVERIEGGAVTHRKEISAAELDAEALFDAWLRGPQINPAGLVWEAGFFKKIGGWDESIAINQDGEIVLRALLHRPRLGRLTDGRGLYHLGHASLSSRHNEAKLDNYVTTLTGLLEAADRAGFGSRTGGVEKTLYGVARMAFRADWDGTGRRALGVLAARGNRRHHGGLAHRAVAGLLGLERKVKLWGS